MITLRPLAKCGFTILLVYFAFCPDGDAAKEWIDADTGYRVVRLSQEAGTASLYFHQNPFTEKGDKCVVTTRAGLAAIDLKTREIEPLVEGRASHVVVGRKTRQVFYVRDDAVYATHLDSKQTREIAKFSPEFRRGSGFGVNADETLLVGSMVEEIAAGRQQSSGNSTGRVSRLEQRWAMHLPMALYTIEAGSGKISRIYGTNEWLNHVQCSPSDPGRG